MLGGSAFAAKPTAKPAAPKTAVKRTMKATKPRMASHAKRGHYITAARAEKVALARYHGKVMGHPVLQKENGRHDYAVRLMSGKTAREVRVDAATGKIMSARIMTASESGRRMAKAAPKSHARKMSATKHSAKATAKKTAKVTAKKAAGHKS